MSIEKEKAKGGKRTVALTAGIIVVFCLIVGIICISYDVLGVSTGGTLHISEGMTVSEIADSLHSDGVIKYPFIFKLISRAEGYDKKIQAGKVDILHGMSYNDILKAATTASTNGTKITIPEGFELKDIKARLVESGIVSEDDLNEALEMDYDYEFLKNLPERENKLEGYLFPDTYVFADGVTAKEIVDEMLNTFDRHFLSEYYDRAKKLNMTTDQIVTLASIIERESENESESAKVAGVFYNRLKKNMRLQSCATVQYILKERKSVLSVDDTKIESPYNTYRHEGLPLGPIASPGDSSIKAALYPEKTTALYFVMGADGKHIYSDTYEEHLAAKKSAGDKND